MECATQNRRIQPPSDERITTVNVSYSEDRLARNFMDLRRDNYSATDGYKFGLLCCISAAIALVASEVAIRPSATVAFGAPQYAPAPTSTRSSTPRQVLETEIQSPFSRIRVYRSGSLRTLTFVRADGSEAVESQVELTAPHRQIFDYTKLMFTHYLHVPAPKRVCIVGLGGGSMVYFLRKYAPEVKVTVIEIDPAIIEVAGRFFGIKPDKQLEILQHDGAKYFCETDNVFDVIYLDAFLSVSDSTDSTGVPLDLKADEFLRVLRNRLTQQGVAVFNVNHHSRSDADIRQISAAFCETYIYRLPGQSVLVATLQDSRDDMSVIAARARDFDKEIRAEFKFENLIRYLQR